MVPSPIPAAGFMAPPTPAPKSKPKTTKSSKPRSAGAPVKKKTTTTTTQPDMKTLRAAARDAEMAAKALLGLSRNLRKQR